MKAAGVERKAVHLLGTDDSVYPGKARRAYALPLKLGIMLLIASLNSVFWMGVVLLGGMAVGIEVGAPLLTAFGAVILAISSAGLSVVMLERR